MICTYLPTYLPTVSWTILGLCRIMAGTLLVQSCCLYIRPGRQDGNDDDDDDDNEDEEDEDDDDDDDDDDGLTLHVVK